MALPLLILVPTIATGIYGLIKGGGAVIDNNDASDVNKTAESTVRRAQSSVNDQRQATRKVLTDYGDRKLRAFNGIVPAFIDTFGQLKNVELVQSPELDNLKLTESASAALTGLRSDYQFLKDSGLGLGAGLGSGAALAFGAYSGTMALGTASTGAAISSLSGVAATNATLAWLGGGSIAAGGGGMALGSMVLSGIVAGPALAIFGHIIGNKAEAALADAKSNLEKAKTWEKEAAKINQQLAAILTVTALANNTFSKISTHLRRSVYDLQKVLTAHGTDYSAYSPESQQVVFRAVKFAQLIKAMIDTPILDKNGGLVLSTEKRVRDISHMMDGDTGKQ